MKKQYLETGKIVSTHGIKGEVRVQPWCDDSYLLTELSALYLDNGKKMVTVERARVQKNVVVMKIEGINTIEEAMRYRNQILYLNRDDLDLEDDMYFIQDLIGMKVVDADDPFKSYGTVKDITQTGANDVYHVQDGEHLRLVPAIPDVIIETNMEQETIKIRPLKGLFEDED